MKLHAKNGALPVPNRHDHPVGGLGGHLQFAWEMVRIDGQGMVPSHSHRRGAVAKDPFSVVADWAGTAMHRSATEHQTTKRDPDCLVSKADTQDWNLVRELTNHIDRTSGLFRSLRTRRNHDRLRIEASAPLDIDLVAADHSRITIQPTEIPGKVVDERIVIVEQ